MKNLLITMTVFLLLAACQQSKVADVKSADKVRAESQETSMVATTNMKFEHTTSSERASVGVPYDIEINFSGSADSVLNAEFSTSSELQMMSNASESIQMNKAGKAETQTITVVPQSEGFHYINIIQSGAKQKPSVIRVIAGDKNIKEYLKTPGTLVEQEDGSKVISMKADEG